MGDEMTLRARTSKIAIAGICNRLAVYAALIKSAQTALLVLTGLAGYMSVREAPRTWPAILALIGSLFLAISGSTLLNMVYDRDIDSRMPRTARRPLPAGRIEVGEAAIAGLAASAAGVGWAIMLSPLYGLAIFAGLFFDVVVYTVWLKRRTPWSIIWGGIAGGMPVMAGRTLGLGHPDLIGLCLALAVLLWIPTHILTFSLKKAAEYQQGGVPVLPNTHGERLSRLVLFLSTCGAVVVMALAATEIGVRSYSLVALLVLGAALLALALASLLRRSPRLDLALFKLASLYMLGSMALIIAGV